MLAPYVNAEFTAAEKAELTKIVLSKVDASTIWRRLGGDILSNGAITVEPNRQSLYQVMLDLEVADFKCGLAFANIASNHTGADISFPSDRASLVSTGKARVDSCADGFRALDSSLSSLDAAVGGNVFIQAARSSAQTAATRLDSFDDSLAYTDWRPTSHPSVVGPHGDDILALHFLARSHLYFHQTLNDVIRIFGSAPVFPSDAWVNLKDAAWDAHSATNHLSRAWGLDAEIVLTDDYAKIEADRTAGSGLRPFAFHRLLLEVEYMLNRGYAGQVAGGTMALISGRTSGQGFGTDIGNMGQALTNMIRKMHQVNDITVIRQWWTSGNTEHNSGDPNGKLVEFYRDFFDFWRDADAWGAAVMLFFHAIPAPPCGEGTHPVGGVCVSDGGGCPEGQTCQPPQQCPSFVATYSVSDLNGSVVVTPMCIEQ
jgi:hypothetical protein